MAEIVETNVEHPNRPNPSATYNMTIATRSGNSVSGLLTQRFGPERLGPEADLQVHLEASLCSLFDLADGLTWSGGSVPVGAGQPDLILATCLPEVSRLKTISYAPHVLLGYLRSVGFATPETISAQLGRSQGHVRALIEQLSMQEILQFRSSKVGLSRDWYGILKDVVAIEVKVSDWRRAIQQAIRNTIVAHRSYVALPSRVASRIHEDTLLKANGIGILTISDDGDVKISRRARKSQPKIWSYYYSIACMASQSIGRSPDAVRGSN